MDIYTVFALAVALGTDAFSMCLGLGIAGVTMRQVLIISFTVLVFHIVMPLLGWYAGGLAGSVAGRAAAIAGALLLIYLGGKMVHSSIKGGESMDPKVVLVNTWGLLLLAASVSMDALSVGFSLGARQVDLLLTAGVIGLVAGVMTAAGLFLGRIVGNRVGERAVLGGGILLVIIGVRMILP
ncbi:MAG: manganese efflux pump MntP family protein [Firmicutes bacterium]|nr:manganese efflux pump MntP family protein [Bacillota bacterium]